MEKFKKAINDFLDRRYLSWIVVSAVMYLIIETINQRGIPGLFGYIFGSPWAFILNLALVMLTYSFALFIRRRLFCYTLVSLLWAIMAVINLILIIQRNTQFNASDVLIFRYGIFITTRYLTLFHCLLIAVGLTLAALAVIFMFMRGYKCEKGEEKKTPAIIVASVAVLAVVMIIIGNLTGMLMPRFTNISKGYSKNGFIYAYGCSIFAMGVDKPENFSEDSVQGIVATLPEDDKESDKTPNVIFLQLESFIDPDQIKDLELDGDPVPNFNRLIEEYPSGNLTVHVLGGGTANTEFEVMSGMNIEDFGTIEYPYETYADRATCETMAYNYKSLGYKSHAIHNFSAGFYMRDKVFANLGFDTFTSFEYMTDIEYNPIGWAKDKILERYIMSALTSTEERDFIYTISVQGHGSYPNDFNDADGSIEAIYHNDDVAYYKAAIEYYISQLREMDAFIGDLTETLSAYDEPTVLVMYGDHLPGIGFDDSMIESGSLYQTEYVVWSNCGIEGDDKDLHTYQLAAHVQQLLGISTGQLTKFHQTYMGTEEYSEYLKVLEYDIIEGDMLTYGGKNPFKATDITFGVEEISITNAYTADRALYVEGVNFNEHSAVYINGVYKITEYLNSGKLMVDGVTLKASDVITVAQMSYQMPWSYLSQTDEYIYTATEEAINDTFNGSVESNVDDSSDITIDSSTDEPVDDTTDETGVD